MVSPNFHQSLFVNPDLAKGERKHFPISHMLLILNNSSNDTAKPIYNVMLVIVIINIEESCSNIYNAKKYIALIRKVNAKSAAICEAPGENLHGVFFEFLV